jgi:hypothetical protein
MPAQDDRADHDHHAHHHDHGHGHDEPRHRAEAQEPTLSLLRASAVQRLAGVAVLLAALWVIVMAVIR